jgi:hypothetical protein
MRWAEHVAGIFGRRMRIKMSLKIETERPLRRPRRGLDVNINTNSKENSM